jgi:heme A synthase
VYAIPVFYFLFTRRIPWREFGIYFAMGMLFILQAFAGWFMVASGLVERPSVNHYLLTVHLSLALSLFGESADRFRSSLWLSCPRKVLTALEAGAGRLHPAGGADRVWRADRRAEGGGSPPGR